MQFIHHYNSPLGGITEASDGDNLIGLWFDGQKYFADTLGSDHEEKELPVFKQTDKWLDIYFSGNDPGFTPPLGIKTSAFRKSVWEIMLTIPYGKTMTYGEIAEKLLFFYGHISGYREASLLVKDGECLFTILCALEFLIETFAYAIFKKKGIVDNNKWIFIICGILLINSIIWVCFTCFIEKKVIQLKNNSSNTGYGYKNLIREADPSPSTPTTR